MGSHSRQVPKILYERIWPRRDDPFSQAMNAATKAAVTHRPVDDTESAHFRAFDAPLAHWVRRKVATTDIAVIGSCRSWPS